MCCWYFPKIEIYVNSIRNEFQFNRLWHAFCFLGICRLEPSIVLLLRMVFFASDSWQIENAKKVLILTSWFLNSCFSTTANSENFHHGLKGRFPTWWGLLKEELIKGSCSLPRNPDTSESPKFKYVIFDMYLHLFSQFYITVGSIFFCPFSNSYFSKTLLRFVIIRSSVLKLYFEVMLIKYYKLKANKKMEASNFPTRSW